MNFNNSIIKDIIIEKFFDDLFFGISDYMSNLSGGDLDDVFENYIDFIEVSGIDLNEVINHQLHQIDNEIEISGKMEVEISVDGNVYHDKDVLCIESTVMGIEVDYIFYFDTEENEYKDFETTEIFI